MDDELAHVTESIVEAISSKRQHKVMRSYLIKVIRHYLIKVMAYYLALRLPLSPRQTAA
jgi:hypothetical protein